MTKLLDMITKYNQNKKYNEKCEKNYEMMGGRVRGTPKLPSKFEKVFDRMIFFNPKDAIYFYLFQSLSLLSKNSRTDC